MQNDMKLKAAMDAFVQAASELSRIWEMTDHTGDYLIDGYPFGRSFDEVVHQIMDWRDKNFPR